jgi:hypothetical protein
VTRPDPSSYDVRSKNAGPFWLTIDIFCHDAGAFRALCDEPRVQADEIARLLRGDAASVKVFRIGALNVIKISLPRPVVQGSLEDRDLHGAQWAHLVQESLARD